MLKSLLTYWREVFTYLLDLIPCIVSRKRLDDLEDLERLIMEGRAELQQENLKTFLAAILPAEMDAPLPKVNHQAGECVAKFISPYQVPMGMN